MAAIRAVAFSAPMPGMAERYGAAVPLGRLLELIAADCTPMRPGGRPRSYEARYGIRYVLPPAEPLPLDAPARTGEAKSGPAGITMSPWP